MIYTLDVRIGHLPNTLTKEMLNIRKRKHTTYVLSIITIIKNVLSVLINSFFLLLANRNLDERYRYVTFPFHKC